MAGKRSGGARRVVAGIDARLSELERELEPLRGLMAEQRTLLAARRQLTGETGPAGASRLSKRVTQDEVAACLSEDRPTRANAIAKQLSVPLTNVSQHLLRGKDTRFKRRNDGWYLRTTGQGKKR